MLHAHSLFPRSATGEQTWDIMVSARFWRIAVSIKRDRKRLTATYLRRENELGSGRHETESCGGCFFPPEPTVRDFRASSAMRKKLEDDEDVKMSSPSFWWLRGVVCGGRAPIYGM